MITCQNLPSCANCSTHYQKLRPLVKQVNISKRFKKDAPDFNINTILDCQHTYFTKLHKLEETIQGNHIFRALTKRTHIVYVIDKDYRMIFLRAFDNFNSYKKFLVHLLKAVGKQRVNHIYYMHGNPNPSY